jgi:hypothetical protein
MTALLDVVTSMRLCIFSTNPLWKPFRHTLVCALLYFFFFFFYFCMDCMDVEGLLEVLRDTVADRPAVLAGS